jgi:hypothetical protein
MDFAEGGCINRMRRNFLKKRRIFQMNPTTTLAHSQIPIYANIHHSQFMIKGGEPLVHFGLNNYTRSSPPLRTYSTEVRGKAQIYIIKIPIKNMWNKFKYEGTK